MPFLSSIVKLDLILALLDPSVRLIHNLSLVIENPLFEKDVCHLISNICAEGKEKVRVCIPIRSYLIFFNGRHLKCQTKSHRNIASPKKKSPGSTLFFSSFALQVTSMFSSGSNIFKSVVKSLATATFDTRKEVVQQ